MELTTADSGMEILEFKETKSIPDPVHAYPASLRQNSVPIVIDNGSYQCRVGWATQKKPCLVFKNLIAKPRKERSKKDKDSVNNDSTPQLQVGNDIVNIEAVRFQLKTQFDKNVVTHLEAQEHILDYTFAHLGIDGDKCIPHPIVMTEAYLNPNSSRQLMSELLFECYNVPSVAYGVDCLFAYHLNEDLPKPVPKNALIINIGYHTMHVTPMLESKVDFGRSRRINTGGYHVISFLHRLLQLKYPVHANAITLSRAEQLLHSVCQVALDYREELKKWTDSDYYDSNIKRVQLPYAASVPTSGLTLEQQKERKKEMARRLIEINARKREERLAEDEEKLNQLLAIQDLIDVDGDTEEFEKCLASNGLKNLEDVQKNISLLYARIEKTKQKIVAANSSVSEETGNAETESSRCGGSGNGTKAKIPGYDVVNDGDLQTYLTGIKRKRQEILQKRAARKQRRQDMAKRRTAAGQERMRLISQLARKEKGNDDFGSRDEDWDIYKTISREGGDSDSEMEQEKLLEYEEILRQHDPMGGGGAYGSGDGGAPGEAHQLHIGVERFRAPELLFKPSMIGSIEAGLSEVIAYVLSLFNNEDQLKLAGNVCVMGGCANLPGLKERLTSDLVSVRPFRSFSQVQVIKEPGLSGWKGARSWAADTDTLRKYTVTKAEYDERGNDFFRQHPSSNPYYPCPKSGAILDMDV